MTGKGTEAAVAVIMAGGEGRRFWPASTLDMPKQFLRLLGGQSLLQRTVERLKDLISEGRVLVVTSERHAATTLSHLPDLPAQNVVTEPLPRSTAPAVALAALHIRHRFGDVPVAVLPADHWVGDLPAFRTALERALDHCQTFDGLITFGVRPTRPETGYGYIEVGPEADEGFHQVVRFVEKPDPDEARALSTSGTHLWNSGMFVWRNDVFLSELETHQPVVARALGALSPHLQTEEYPERLREAYRDLHPLSLDYGLMERSRNLRVLPVDFQWDDIGSWAALARHLEPDPEGNFVGGQGAVLVECRNCIVYSEDHTVRVLAANDLVIAATGNGILVCRLDRAGDIKRVLDACEATRPSAPPAGRPEASGPQSSQG